MYLILSELLRGNQSFFFTEIPQWRGQRSDHAFRAFLLISASVWSKTFAFQFSSSDNKDFSGRALTSALLQLRFGSSGTRREINFARPLCLWNICSSKYSHAAIWEAQLRRQSCGWAVWSSGQCTRISLDQFSPSFTPVSITLLSRFIPSFSLFMQPVEVFHLL